MLCTEGAVGRSDAFRHVRHIPYVALRKRFQTILLNALEHRLGKASFRSIKNAIYAKTSNGFYVRANPRKDKNIKKAIDYVVRYTGRPVMAQSRILNYDGQSVTFFYERHEDHQRIEETVSAFDFIKRLIIHIPDTQFKMIRYYGLYAHPRHNHGKIIPLFKPHHVKVKQLMTRWRLSLMAEFNHDPLFCYNCRHQLVFLKHVFNNTS